MDGTFLTRQRQLGRIHTLKQRMNAQRRQKKSDAMPEDYLALRQRLNKAGPLAHNHANATKINIQSIIRKWIRFCDEIGEEDWRTAIQDCDKGTTMAFLHFICEKDRVKKQNSIHQYLLSFKMLYNRINGFHMDTNDAREVLKYLKGDLTKKFKLDMSVKAKPVLGVDDLLLLLTCHWARDTSTFPTERHRAQLATILLFLAYTGCRPAELVDASKKSCDISESGDDSISATEVAKRCKALCYEDICLMIVRSSVRGERDALAMEVTMAHHKGVDRKPKPTIFFFTEVDEPIFCPIVHVVALALADDAFEAPSLRTAERIFSHKVWGPVCATPLFWKQSMMEVPIFRQAERTADGLVTSAKKALPYSNYNDCLDRLGKMTGFKESLTSYCFRRGTANAVDGAATEAVRDQVMRHTPGSAVYNGAYINEKVKFDVQSAFLGRPSAHGILQALTHMKLHCDPRAPIFVPDEVLRALPLDPEIVELEQQRDELKAGTYRIKGKEEEEEIRRLTNLIGNAKARRRIKISEEYRADYFRRRPTEDIEKQSKGMSEEEYAEPVVQHQIPERAQLVELICTFPKDLTPQDIVSRRITVTDLMMALCHEREVPRRYQRQATPTEELDLKEASPDPSPLPLVCKKTQCPFCIGDESKRATSFCRPSKMMDHVERSHLRGIVADRKISCRHPVCQSSGLVLNNLMHFKNHVATVHGITLRA